MTDPTAPLCVLVVDDDPDSADPIAEVLRARGHRARAVYCGADAVVAAADDLPNVILVALSMPVLDGFGLVPWLQAQAPGALLAAVASGWEAGLAERCAAAGFAALVIKPVAFSDLEGLLDRVREPR